MATIYTKDALRAAVQGATGGKITVLYTEKGQPSHMYVMSAFNLEDVNPDLGTGVDPMFKVGGETKTERFLGAYPGVRLNGELISLPGMAAQNSINHDDSLSAARANGSGWGLMTNNDYAGVARWCRANGFVPRGNTAYGKSSDAPFETGVRADGGMPGVTSGTAITLSGSGPASWRHDGTHAGISDLVGNVWEWAPGLRLLDGEIQVIADNNAAMSSIDLSAASSEWRAIDGSTGALVMPGAANSVKVASSGTENYTIVRNGNTLEATTNPGTTPVSEGAVKTLKLYGVYPEAADLDGDYFSDNPEGERLPFRGGYWNSGALAGLSAVNLRNARSSSNSSIGARPAFVL